MTSLLIPGAEIARCFGSDATRSAIDNVVKRQVRPAVKNILETLRQGGDPNDLNLTELLWTTGKGASGRTFAFFCLLHTTLISFIQGFAHQACLSFYVINCYGTDVARYLGFDANGKSIKNVWFNRVQPAVQKLKDAVGQGGDPKDIEINILWAATQGSTRMFRFPIFPQYVLLLSSPELMSTVGGSRIDIGCRDCEVLRHQLYQESRAKPF